MSTTTQSRFLAHRLLAAVLVCLAILTGTAVAQLPVPVSTQFDLTGFLQEATVNVPGNAHSGGTLKVNNHVVTVPAETIVILPANALTWEELFALAPAPYTGVATGMAMNDLPAPISTYEVHVIGNRVNDQYIAGLIYIAQQGLNSGAGFINYIDYSVGEMRVGGLIGDSTTGTRVRINDPNGRYGRPNSPDPRFTVDADNPTIASGTGFPMCLPRVTTDPTIAGNSDDPLCPQGNRPLLLTATGATTYASNWTMPDPATLTVPGQLPDPRIQAPFEVGDYITFAGTLVQDSTSPMTGPYPGTAFTYISAHTIINNVAIFTWPNTNPAYVLTDTTILGTGGLTVLGAGEASIRTRFEGMTTDPSRVIHLYGMDLSSDGLTETDRDWGYTGVDPGPPTGAVKGRWRFRPPCTATTTTFTDKSCSPPPAGTFLPPTRELRAVLEKNPNSTTQINAWTAGSNVLYANGLIAGQYHAPILEYIFPENIPGSPVVPNNFEAIPFLAQGGYSSSTGVIAGQLSPWPGDPATAPALTGAVAPVASATASATSVASGASITLNASATGTTPMTYSWIQTAGTAGTFSATSGASVSWTAPTVAASETATFQVTATNIAGSSTATVSVTVTVPALPVITSATASSNQVASNGNVILSAAASGATPITFNWSQTAGPTGTFNPAPPTSASVTWTAPPVSAATTATFQVTATNSVGTSAPASVSVTINAVGAPTISPIAAQTVLSGAAVSIPVTATSPNSAAQLSLSAVQTTAFTLTNFTVSAPSQTCTASDCTANWTVSFIAPTTSGTDVINFSFTATDTSVTPNLSSAAETTSVTVNPTPTPVVSPIATQTVASGTLVTMPVTATSINTAANLTLSVVQTTTFTLSGFSVSAPSKACTGTGCTFNWTVSFTAPTLSGQATVSAINFTVTATDVSVTPNLTSAPVFATVNVNPLPDTMTVTLAQYRTGKQRLVINITDSVVSPSLVLKLQPYVTTTGAIYNPDPAAGGVGNVFTNTGNGLYVITLVGAPEPAVPPATPLDVKSSINGDSGFFALTSIRK